MVLPGLAAPLLEPDERDRLQPAAAEPPESPVDVQGWIQREATTALLDSAAEYDRAAFLRHGWQGRPPTWIQDSVRVNLGDFPTLDRAAENAERDLKTLEWVLEQQRRAAAGQPRQAAEGDEPDAAPPDNWLRRLLPTHWIATLKANREWVAAGGTALLVIVWGTTMFARRPTSQPQAPQPVAAPPKRRRRRRYRDAFSSTG